MRVVQIAQHATDLARATRFYTNLLGVEPRASFDPPGLVFFDLDGVRLMLEGPAPSALLYLAVDDLTATIARLAESGIAIEAPPHLIFTHEDDALGPAGSQEWQAVIRDSEGNLVGLVEHRQGTAG